jgi:BirA family biotin operon repressor/biotin-[acetyl-CoA-carboxylase] ligase
MLTIEVADTVDSTNSELLRRHPATDIHRHLLVTENQTAGRGRRGRNWLAAAGGSLTFSLGWRFERGGAHLSGLSLAVGAAVAGALDRSGFGDIELKWPNDLVHRGRKLGGILIELSREAIGTTVAIIGVGLNVRLPASVGNKLCVPITDLASVKPAAAVDRNRLLARIASELATALQRYSSQGFAPFVAAWRRRDALVNQPVQIVLPDGKTIRGVAAGVDGAGALLIEDGPRRLRFVNGEVSVRRA